MPPLGIAEELWSKTGFAEQLERIQTDMTRHLEVTRQRRGPHLTHLPSPQQECPFLAP